MSELIPKYHCSDVIKYISTYIPPSIYLNKQKYYDLENQEKIGNLNFEFNIFVNHAHYDIRLGYFERYTNDFSHLKSRKFRDGSFLYLREGIDCQEDLCAALVELRMWLEGKKLLHKPYSDYFGYTRSIYEKAMDYNPV